MDKFSFLNTAHTAYFADLYDQYLQNPDTVEPSWRAFFQGYDFGSENYGLEGEIVEGVSAQMPEYLQKEFQIIKLIDGYRMRGHLFTKTNPVRSRRTYTPTLDIENFGLTANDLDTVFNAGEILGIGVQTLREILVHLERIYCSSIGVEYMYLRNPEVISWWQGNLNFNDNQPNFSVDKKKYILSKLNQAVNFENFLQTKYVGQKRFSLEGGESLIPAISNVLFYAVEKYGVKECVLGMAHRGRLSTLVNIFRKPMNELLSEFDGKDFEDEDIDGDVKYHLGLTLDKTYQNGKTIQIHRI